LWIGLIDILELIVAVVLVENQVGNVEVVVAGGGAVFSPVWAVVGLER
jgi:hypothetical protein